MCESLPGGTGLCSADHRAVQDVMDLFRVFSLDEYSMPTGWCANLSPGTPFSSRKFEAD
jgi:hypothetical protein